MQTPDTRSSVVWGNLSDAGLVGCLSTGYSQSGECARFLDPFENKPGNVSSFERSLRDYDGVAMPTAKRLGCGYHAVDHLIARDLHIQTLLRGMPLWFKLGSDL